MADVSAIVVSGRGMATKLRSHEIAELSLLVGTTFVSGSLNLVAKKPLWLDSRIAIYSSNDGHLYWPAFLEGVPVIVNRWKWDCPAHIYEIYANTKLREALKLDDGDEVHLSLDKSILDSKRNRSKVNIISWYLIWFCREKLYYSSNKYLEWISCCKLIKKIKLRGSQL